MNASQRAEPPSTALAAVWGRASGPVTITVVASQNRSISAVPNATGDWFTLLPAAYGAATGPVVIRAALQADPAVGAELHDVLFGDVWVCSGFVPQPI